MCKAIDLCGKLMLYVILYVLVGLTVISGSVQSIVMSREGVAILENILDPKPVPSWVPVCDTDHYSEPCIRKDRNSPLLL